MLDLDAYCRRINFEGELAPTLEVLQSLAFLHATAIPFENLDVLLHRRIDLTAEALQQKLVFDRRGGYCFEQNGLMLAVLSQIGFSVTPLSGRVRQGLPRDILPPRTHLFLSVNVEGQDWIFDVGVGSMSLTSPIRRVLDVEQLTLHETRRLVFEEGKFFHQCWSGSGWVDIYEFTGEEMSSIDREVSNWWTSTNPNAKFSQNLFCARALPDGERLGILNDRLIRRRGQQVLEETAISRPEMLLEILDKRFGIELPIGTRFGSGPKPWPN